MILSTKIDIRKPASFSLVDRIRALFIPTTTTLLSPFIDVVMAGGASIVFFFVLNFFIGSLSSATFNTWAIAMYYAAFLVNYPHFTSSYQLLYRDGRAGFFAFTENRFLAIKLWWAGFVVPLLLIGYFFFVLASGNKVAMGYLANAMYFFVGWHYVKQIYGCMIVLSSIKKVYYSALERWSMLVTLYALWAVSFISSNTNGGSQAFYQITYTSGKIPMLYLYGALSILGLALLVMFITLLLKYKAQHEHPPLSAVTALISIFLWFFPFYIWFPGFGSQYFFYIIPFFHSTQYLLFVLAYKRNWAMTTSAQPKNERVLARLTSWGIAQFVLLPTLVVTVIMYTELGTSLETLLYRWFGGIPNIAQATWNYVLLFAVLITVGVFLGWKWTKKSAYGKFNFFFVNAYVLGLLLFTLIPNALDILARNHMLPSFLTYDSVVFGGSLYLFFFLIFINVHHYFIDNVIWRRDNPQIRKYLFSQ